MHRINLRGPWSLASIEDRLEASRKFHAPPDFVDEGRLPKSLEAFSLNSPLLVFNWQTAMDWPVECIRCNDAVIWGEAPHVGVENEREFFAWDVVAGVGRIKLNGILRPFNEIVLVWQHWPSEWSGLTGRYTPQPSHPIHFDSWLEIQT